MLNVQTPSASGFLSLWRTRARVTGSLLIRLYVKQARASADAPAPVYPHLNSNQVIFIEMLLPTWGSRAEIYISSGLCTTLGNAWVTFSFLLWIQSDVKVWIKRVGWRCVDVPQTRMYKLSCNTTISVSFILMTATSTTFPLHGLNVLFRCMAGCSTSPWWNPQELQETFRARQNSSFKHNVCLKKSSEPTRDDCLQARDWNDDMSFFFWD